MNLDLIDFDEVQDHNGPASLIFSDEDVSTARKKVDSCKNYLSGSAINLRPYVGDYKQFIESGYYRQYVPDIILCFANERNIWLDVGY